MAAISDSSHQATHGSGSHPRYFGNSLSTHSLANRETDTKHALRTYLQDKQAHEKLALKLQTSTAIGNESTRRHREEMKEKLRHLEAKI